MIQRKGTQYVITILSKICCVGRDSYLHDKAKNLKLEHGGANLDSCPGRHLTLVRPCIRKINYQLPYGH